MAHTPYTASGLRKFEKTLRDFADSIDGSVKKMEEEGKKSGFNQVKIHTDTILNKHLPAIRMWVKALDGWIESAIEAHRIGQEKGAALQAEKKSTKKGK